MKHIRLATLTLAFLTLIPMLNASISLKDISGYRYEEAIKYLQENGIINGYPDSTYKPDKTVNRAEFIKILIESSVENFGDIKSNYVKNCFNDVPSDQWFTPYVCYAKEQGIISGYPDATFKASNNINLVEALKIIVNVFGIPTEEKSGEWYESYLNAMDTKGFIPSTFGNLEQKVTRGEMAEMTWRTILNLGDKDKADAVQMIKSPCQFFQEIIPEDIDINVVRDAWLNLYNDARIFLGKSPYTYNGNLNRTAYTWSSFVAERGYMDHKRPGQTAYYDYNIINKWFSDLGLSFKNVNRVTFSENIGWGVYSCPSQGDCTDEIIKAIKTTFDFYMSEKNKSYKPHYDSLMNNYFKEIGLGLAFKDGKYYLTVHYATEITSNPLPVCKR